MEDLYDDIIDLQLAGHSGPLAGGSVSHRKKDNVQKLMGAMYAAQLKKLQDRQLHANDPHLGGLLSVLKKKPFLCVATCSQRAQLGAFLTCNHL